MLRTNHDRMCLFAKHLYLQTELHHTDYTLHTTNTNQRRLFHNSPIGIGLEGDTNTSVYRGAPPSSNTSEPCIRTVHADLANIHPLRKARPSLHTSKDMNYGHVEAACPCLIFDHAEHLDCFTSRFVSLPQCSMSHNRGWRELWHSYEYRWQVIN